MTNSAPVQGATGTNVLFSVWRIAKIAIAYAVIYALNGILSLHLPFWGPILLTAVINAVSKFFRDQWGIDVKVV